jgi:DNA-binding MarR family transcriptional regulator
MKNNGIKNFEKFIKKRVGNLNIIENSTNNLIRLPKFYIKNFSLYDADLIVNDSEKRLKISIIEVYNNNFSDIETLKKQISNILKLENMDEKYILLFSNLEDNSQRLLIKNNIPYYSEKDSSMFLPFLYLELHSKLEIQKKFTPSEQLIFCYILEKSNKNFTQKSLEIKLELSKSIIQKTLKKFEDLEIIEREGYTRNLKYNVIGKRKELYDVIRKYLTNPIRKKIYVEKNIILNKFLEKAVVSSESTLSNLSLYKSDNIDYYALEKKDFRDLEIEMREQDITIFSKKKEVELLSKYNKIVSVEEWSYDPKILKGKGNNIDIVSLYMILKKRLEQENGDYRLQQELEILLEDYLNEYH